jgi:rifampicin phosphotransferase
MSMTSPYDDVLMLPLDSPVATLASVGGKGASLARLAAAGLPVPHGFHITTLGYRRFVSENQLTDAIVSAAARATADDPASLDTASAQIQSLMANGTIPDDVAVLIRRWYDKLGTDNPPVAVRSSATAEDLPEMSFAGQQDTYLNVRGGENVLAAVQRCWASLWTARALGYRARHGIRPEDVALAVVVQQLVPADVAGILFTANPLSGKRDQVIINAAWGLGESIVGGQVTPDSFIVNKQTGAIVSQEIASKDVMTARLPAGTRDEQVPADQREQASLRPEQAARLAELGVQIEQLYGQPMDIEWAIDGGHISIVQARPITALPEPCPTLDWALPHPRGRYVRSSVIELLPDPLSPLFATLAIPQFIDAYRRLMQFIGLTRALPDQLLVSINGYAYYDFSHFGAWPIILALPRLIPRGFGWTRRAQARWADEARPRYAAVIAAWASRELGATPSAQLLDGARAIVQSAADHYLTIQSGILPVAFESEMLFTSFYNRLIKRKDDPTALTYLLGFDSAPILAEKSLYDLATWARTQPELAGYLTSTPSAHIADAYRPSSAPIADADSWREFCRRFLAHLERFGHAIYDLDFAKSLAVDEPAPLLEALKYFLTGEARSPHERQSAAAAARERAMQSLLSRLKGLRRRWFTRLVQWAQHYAPLRENALADVGLGWPLLRQMIREIGRRLVVAGAVADPDDVFWMKRDEVEAASRALDAIEAVSNYLPVVAERRATWERLRRVTPPVVLPIKGGARFFGIDWSEWMPARTDQAVGNTIKGIGASPGRVTGAARVIHGPGEFKLMRQGDILVARITTPAWTPLFALAVGIVTDVGGPLSHSSIVAREYQIPAVLGTGVATARIRNGQCITVDGDCGVVTMSVSP